MSLYGRFFCIFICSAFVHYGTAQSAFAEKPKVLLFPYEEVMLVSDINEPLAEGSSLTLHELKSVLRQSIAQALTGKGRAAFQVTCLCDERIPDVAEAQQQVIYHISRYYTPIPPSALRVRLSPDGYFTAIADSLMTPAERANRLYDRMEKHLAASLSSEDFWRWLESNYTFDYVVLLNQLDLVQTDDPVTRTPTGERLLRLHYTVLNHKGEPVTGGLVRDSFAYSENNVWNITGSVFPRCANQLWEKMLGSIWPQ